ncbi:hypothetical protein [Halobellus rarus]|uniref:Uncharacterized protein n=1 Tax=Halobellus rarus TaxID=1126237 RepID=A0ABD6CH80_9EURY|nr:hypothetical protein [Halobellus rarus]
MTEPSDPRSAGEAIRQAATRAVSGSRVVGAVQSGTAQIRRYVRTSFLYQWLTAEPDPEVIVIDLRETWTVSPFLSVLDRIISELNRALDSSRIGSLATAAGTAVRATPLRVLGFVLTALGATVAIGTLLTTGATTGLIIGLVVILSGAVATRDERDWKTLSETQTVEWLRRVFEPPAPPENTADHDSTDDNSENTDRSADSNELE